MKKIIFFLFAVGFFGGVWAQSEDNRDVQIVNHEVLPGETVRMLSLKYLVTPSDIYKLNKFAIDGIRQGMVLQIPVRRKSVLDEQIQEGAAEDSEEAAEQSKVSDDVPSPQLNQAQDNDGGSSVSVVHHTVARGETLSALSRMYGVTVNDLKSRNEKVLQRGLQAGQVLEIPAKNQVGLARQEEPQVGSPSSANIIEHKVEPKETLYSISRKYNVPVEMIRQQNNQLLAQGLKAGQVIKIKPNN